MNKKAFIIAPSLLSADFANLDTEIRKVASGGAEWLHIDVMDGHFVPNLTMGPAIVESIKKVSKLLLDCHLMVEHPGHFIEPFIKAGAQCITVHLESLGPKLERRGIANQFARQIRSHSALAGISIRPKTPINEIFELVELFDLVLVMSVEPGFSGQVFIPETEQRIKAVRGEISKRKLKTLIQVDGGINFQTAPLCIDADILVAGNAVFKTPDPAEAVRQLRQLSK